MTGCSFFCFCVVLLFHVIGRVVATTTPTAKRWIHILLSPTMINLSCLKFAAKATVVPVDQAAEAQSAIIKLHLRVAQLLLLAFENVLNVSNRLCSSISIPSTPLDSLSNSQELDFQLTFHQLYNVCIDTSFQLRVLISLLLVILGLVQGHGHG